VRSHDFVAALFLGSFGVCVGLHAIDNAARRLRKARSLIRLLTLAPGHRLHREQVISTLWPELPPKPATLLSELARLYEGGCTAK